MGTKKYFFFDYDGTLAIPLTRNIPDSTRETLRLLEAQGHFVALATGRLQCNALDFIDSAGIRNVVSDGGNSVTVDGKLLWMCSLDLPPVKACLHRLDDLGVPWAVTTDNVPWRVSSNPDFATISGDYYLPTRYDANLDIEALTQVMKVYIPCATEDIPALVATGVLDDVPWVTYNSGALFVEPMNKDVGIRYLMDYYNAPYEDAVVFGDGKNDISMFCPDWTSVAMGNAVPALKECADYVTDACDQDGIYHACRHFGWI